MTKCSKCNKRSSHKRDSRFDFSRFCPQVVLQPSSVSLTGGSPAGTFNPSTIIASGTGLGRITSATILFTGCTTPLQVMVASAASLLCGFSGFPGFPFPSFGKKFGREKKSKCDDGFSQLVLTLPPIPACTTVGGPATITFFSCFNVPVATAVLTVTA